MRKVDSSTPRLLNYVELASFKTENYLKSPKLPLTVFHGLLGSSTNFRSIVKNSKISRDRRVVTADLRNHGDSFHDSSMELTEMSDDVESLVRHNSFERSLLMGHSLGGLVSMVTALRFPNLFGGIIVVDIAPVNYTEEFKGTKERSTQEHILKVMRDFDFSKVNESQEKGRNTANDILQKDIPSDPLRQFVLQNLINDGTSWGWRVNFNALLDHFDSMVDFSSAKIPEEATFDKPALFVRGEKSGYVQDRFIPTIEKRFTNAEIVAIPNCGHWLHAEKPAAFIDTVADFLNAKSL